MLCTYSLRRPLESYMLGLPFAPWVWKPIWKFTAMGGHGGFVVAIVSTSSSKSRIGCSNIHTLCHLSIYIWQ
jgi:hypothetical protein